MERVLSTISRILKEQHLKIIGSRRELRNEGSEGEFMDLYLIIDDSLHG